MGSRSSIPEILIEENKENCAELNDRVIIDPYLLRLNNDIIRIFPTELIKVIYLYSVPTWYELKDGIVEIGAIEKKIIQAFPPKMPSINSWISLSPMDCELIDPTYVRPSLIKDIALIGNEIFVLDNIIRITDIHRISVYNYHTGEYLRQHTHIPSLTEQFNPYLTTYEILDQYFDFSTANINVKEFIGKIYTITSDEKNKILYIDIGSDIVILNSSTLQPVKYFHRFEKSQSYRRDRKISIAIADNEIYVSNCTSDILVFDSNGTLIEKISVICRHSDSGHRKGFFSQLAISNDKTKLYAICHVWSGDIYLHVINLGEDPSVKNGKEIRLTKQVISKTKLTAIPSMFSLHTTSENDIDVYTCDHVNKMIVLPNGNIAILLHKHGNIILLSPKGDVIKNFEIHDAASMSFMRDGRLIILYFDDTMRIVPIEDLEPVKIEEAK